MRKINNEAELNEVISSNDFTICKIGAEWCGPCRVLENSIKEIEQSNADTAEFVEVDVDEADEDFVASLNVRNIPVMLFYKGGEVFERVAGLISKETILAKIRIMKGE